MPSGKFSFSVYISPGAAESLSPRLFLMDLSELIRRVQVAVGVEPDGKPGPETWGAIYNRLVPEVPLPPTAPLPAALMEAPLADERSEKAIATLLPEVRPYARALVRQAAGVGITIKIISGLRTYAEQDALYAKGRTKPGPKVTNCPGGYSNHNFGLAFDVGVFQGTRYLGTSPAYKAVGALGCQLGLEWGGNWKTIKDEPHFQLRPAWAAGLPERRLLAGLRQRVAAGEPVFA